MKKYLCDTNILIHFFNKHSVITNLIHDLSDKHTIGISYISLAEILVGWGEKRKKDYLPILYDLFPRLEINDQISELSAFWRRSYLEHGITLNLYDCLIAATAKVYDYELVTLNTKDFPMSDISLYPISLK